MEYVVKVVIIPRPRLIRWVGLALYVAGISVPWLIFTVLISKAPKCAL